MLKPFLVLLVGLAPLANLNSAKAPSIVFYLILLTSLCVAVQHRFIGAGRLTLQYRPLIISYAGLLVAGLFSVISHQHWPGANMEGAIRFFVGLWLFLIAFSYIRHDWLRQSFWGVYAAGLVSTAVVFWLSWPDFIRPHTPFHNAVTYGNLMLFLGALSLFSIPWQLTRWHRPERIFKILVAGLIFTGFVLTQTRTGWLAMPVFILIGVVLFCGYRHVWRNVLVTVLVAILAGGIFLSNDALRSRAQQAYTEAIQCSGDNSTAVTSTCIRLQLWRSAIDMFEQNPIIGIGDGGKFADTLKTDSYPKGLISEEALVIYFGEPHNDVLFMLAVFGLPGAVGLLLIYFVPAVYFIRRLLRGSSPQIRAAAAMGAAVCLGFALFGLTELMFRRMHVIGLYTLLIALFIILSDEKVDGQAMTNESAQ